VNLRLFTVLVAVFPPFLAAGVSQGDYWADTWSATDALGRKLPGFEQCGGPKENRTIGIFYFLWLGNHGSYGPYDITELLKENPDHPNYGKPNEFHFWGRPELGYYKSDSDYAMIIHARQLTQAGVDTLIFDVTNAFTYTETYLKLCKRYAWIRQQGEPTPQISFVTHTNSAKTITKLYEEFYAKNLYPQLWFHWKGKPLMLGNQQEFKDLDPKIRDFFTLRHCWAWTSGKETWNWVDNWPQRYGWAEAETKPEEISVAVAQHPTSNIGRSHFKNKQPPANRYGLTAFTDKGPYFSQQIQRALDVDPEFAFITGWNEWVAQRFINTEKEGSAVMLGKPLNPGDTFFVDQYNQEFSRDIEPMEGGHTDNYYYQMAAFIRRYKGVRPMPTASPEKTIAIDGIFEDWKNVSPEYLDSALDCMERNEPGFGQAGPYVNKTGRNNMVCMKVASDTHNIYFYARCEKPITPGTDKNWMLLFIDIDENKATGWEGYDYLVNGQVINDKTTTLKTTAGGWNWQDKAKIDYTVLGNEVEIGIPKTHLGISGPEFRFQFHWADNIQKENDILEFSRSGDSAPERRFNYQFVRKTDSK
jgi:hypothetical protein